MFERRPQRFRAAVVPEAVFTDVAQHVRGLLERDADALVAAVRPDSLVTLPSTSWPRSKHRPTSTGGPTPRAGLITIVLIRCGLRTTDACTLPVDCLLHDGQKAAYLRYFNNTMRREAAVPIDEELEIEIRA